MNTRHRPSVLLVVVGTTVVIGVVALKGCGSGGEPGPNEVFMQAIAFNPMEITIQVGESVTWTNQDIVPHTATSGNPGDEDLGSIFRSPTLFQGGTFTHTFNDAGEFVYFCEVHPGMMRDAKVIVEAGDSLGVPAPCDTDEDCPDGITCIFSNGTDQPGFCDVEEMTGP